MILDGGIILQSLAGGGGGGGKVKPITITENGVYNAIYQRYFSPYGST